MKPKNFNKSVLAGYILLIAIIFPPCSHRADDLTVLIGEGGNNNFIAKKYWNLKPLAQLVNVPDYFDGEQLFTLAQKTAIHIYGVGEISLELSDREKRYYLQNDGFELFFSRMGTVGSPQRLWINHGTREFGNKKNIKCRWVMVKNLKYTAELTIPVQELGIEQSSSDSLQLNIAVADNDDGLVQKAKIAWYGHNEQEIVNKLHSIPLKRRPVGRNRVFEKGKIVDTIPKEEWGNTVSCPIASHVFGFIKDKYDLSGEFKYLFDGDYLYVRVEVFDSRQKTITKKKMKERTLFVDWGWIEDSQGKKLWEMNAKQSSHAGGAFKNQKVDTIISLSKGRYSLHYSTDESHSYGRWTDKPPKTPFYGIVIYKK